ncbi:restriction endonuclease subunit S [Devosia sp. Root635]|uniref:restriction endonuclease subunit S n=1 Tax=Devosia sp. Root635 TaxID=1736575 RepID=UPI0006FD6DCA|nr:restriction endonuclease subunit S [Devosia sp. Root635]KRA42037.1 hypothetical protein ASD80_09940 [Devosia sp. Root635]
MSWEVRKLADIADFNLGKMLDQKKNKGELRPYLANVNVRWGEFELDDLREMRFEDHEVDRYGLRAGDILMCEGGEPGRCAIWRDERPGMMFQKALHRIRPHDGLDSRFLYYSFLQKGRTGGFGGLFTGSTIKHLPKEKLAKIEVAFPPQKEQERIASILSAYDDLIENNRRRMALLEQAARQLYKEWFVSFRFPGHEHVRIIDGAPEGWERMPASAAISINPTTRWLSDGEIRSVPMAAVSEIGMCCDEKAFELRLKSTSVRFVDGDTLFARITPCLENGKTAFVNFLAEGEVACGSSEFIVLRERAISRFAIYLLAREDSFRANAIKSMIGSSGRQRVQPSCFDKYMIAIPPKSIGEGFDEEVRPMFKLIGSLDRQNTQLARARDLLLPRLMSGAIAV